MNLQQLLLATCEHRHPRTAAHLSKKTTSIRKETYACLTGCTRWLAPTAGAAATSGTVVRCGAAATSGRNLSTCFVQIAHIANALAYHLPRQHFGYRNALVRPQVSPSGTSAEALRAGIY